MINTSFVFTFGFTYHFLCSALPPLSVLCKELDACISVVLFKIFQCYCEHLHLIQQLIDVYLQYVSSEDNRLFEMSKNDIVHPSLYPFAHYRLKRFQVPTGVCLP